MTRTHLTGAVMAHPDRLDAARSLIASAPPGFLDLVLDPDPTGPPTGLRTSIRAWSEIPAGATHHLVLEDDARLSEGFPDQARKAVAAAPDVAIVLYNNWSSRNGAAVRLGALAGARWVVPADEYTANVALILPAGIGAGFPDYARRHGGTWPDDVVLARYLRSVDATTYVAVPNLVEHGEFPSLSGNDRHGLRMSACFAAPAPDADWSPDNVLRPDAVPFFKFGLALCSVRQGGRWLTIGVDRYQRRLGIDGDACREGLRAATGLDRVRGSGLVPDRAVEAHWQTAYALGFLAARHGSEVDWREDPLVDRALDSLGPGGLCAELGASRLREVQPALKELAREALFAGARQPAHLTTGRRVVFTGADSTLKRALVDDLADRGHHVRVVSEADGSDTDTGDVVVDVGADAIRVRDSTLHPGVPYGPGVVGPSPVNDLVLQSLAKQPMRMPAGLPARYRFAHVWDIARAVARLVDSPELSGSFDVGDDQAVTPRRLAELVGQVIRAVDIEFAGSAADPPMSADPVGSEHWPPSVDLADGIRTVAQWLAYEVD